MNAVKSEPNQARNDNTNSKIKAGTQKVLQVFITNAANVFLLEAPTTETLLEEQVYLKDIVNSYSMIHDKSVSRAINFLK